jgi:hypothetical protein
LAARTNTLAYYETSQIATVKSFVILGLGECECLKSFTLMKCHGKNAPIATLSITTLSITVKKITLSITALNIVVLSSIMVSVIMLNVGRPATGFCHAYVYLGSLGFVTMHRSNEALLPTK